MINDKQLSLLKVFTYLAKLGAQHGIGKETHLGETLLGIKARVGLEAPAYFIISKAHHELCKIVLGKKQLFWLGILGTVYGDMIHESEYFDPLMRNLEVWLDHVNIKVSGQVKLKLFKGNVMVEGLHSPYSLFDAHVAVYAEGNSAWSGTDARGFSKLFGMGNKIAYQVNESNKQRNNETKKQEFRTQNQEPRIQ